MAFVLLYPATPAGSSRHTPCAVRFTAHGVCLLLWFAAGLSGGVRWDGPPTGGPGTNREGTMAEQGLFSTRFEIDAERRVCVVSLVGGLGPGAVDGLPPPGQGLVRAGFRRFVFDLSKLDHMGSMGLRLLVGLANQLKGDGSVVLCSVNDGMRSVFEMTKVDHVLRTYSSRTEAVDALRA